MVGCDEPYIGDESIRRPPSAKKARTTSTLAARAASSVPTLKVIQLPSPITGSISPLDGMRRSASALADATDAAGAARAVAGQGSAVAATTAAARPRKLRRAVYVVKWRWLCMQRVRAARPCFSSAGTSAGLRHW